MKFSKLIYSLLLVILISTGSAIKADAQLIMNIPDTIRYIDPLQEFFVMGVDTVRLRFMDASNPPSGPLTEKDYEEVAAQLGVEVAAMKAVVEIEAGKAHQGFWTEGKPLINFDLSVYRPRAAKRGVNPAKHPEILQRPNIAKYGSQQAGQQARLDQAMSLDSISAIEGTFWGMFQIGGFNWKLCGTSSQQEFFQLMSRSERDQLELFAEFITRAGLLPALKAKNWSAFARGYNGPSYASRRYHTRLAQAYNKYKK